MTHYLVKNGTTTSVIMALTVGLRP
jgi:hypothetical protein